MFTLKILLKQQKKSHYINAIIRDSRVNTKRKFLAKREFS